MRSMLEMAAAILLAAVVFIAYRHYQQQKAETELALHESRTPLLPDEHCSSGIVLRTIYRDGGAVGTEQELYGMRPVRCVDGWRLDPR